MIFSTLIILSAAASILLVQILHHSHGAKEFRGEAQGD